MQEEFYEVIEFVVFAVFTLGFFYIVYKMSKD